MPTYEYECTSCGQHIEAFQRFAEDPLTTCGACGGKLRKVFHPAGIVFKGPGFYVTDSRSGSRSEDRKDTRDSKDTKDTKKETKKEAGTESSSASTSSSEAGSKSSAPKESSTS